MNNRTVKLTPKAPPRCCWQIALAGVLTAIFGLAVYW